MTIREYIQQRLVAFQLSDADFADYQSQTGLSLDDEYSSENTDAVNKGMIGTIELLLFSPRMKSINEGGFSMSWDYADMGKLYLYLCKRYGVVPNEEAIQLLGLSTIIDRTNIW